MPALTSDVTIPQLRFCLPLDPARLLRARQRIRDYLYASGVQPAAIEPIVLSLEEAMSNAVCHSGSEHDLEISLRLDGRDLVAEVRDRGRGFDIASFDPSHTPDPAATGGRGLYLMGRLMDDLQLCCEGGLEVRVVKRDALSEDERPRPRPRVTMPGDEGYFDERHRALLDEVDERVASLDWEYRYVFVNKAMLEAIRRPEAQVLGRTVWDLFPRIMGTHLDNALREAMELGRSAVLEHQSLATAEWLESRVYPTASGISTFARVIAERKRKELERDELFAALTQSQDRLQTALETARMAYWDWDATIDRTVASPSASEVFGLAPRETLDSSALRFRLIHPDDLERHKALVQSAGERGEGWHAEFRIVRPADGKVAWLEEWATAQRDPATGEIHHRGLVWDITERKRAEEAARAKDEQWRHLTRYAPAGIYEIDFRGPRFVTVNDFMCTYSGYAREELLAMSPFDLLDGDSQARFRERIRKALGGEQIDSTVEYGFISKQGEKRWTILNVTPSFEDGQPVGAFVVGYDVTDRRRAEEALRESESLLRSVIDNSPDAIYVKDTESRWEMANPAVLHMVGRRLDQALGKTDRELYDDPEIGRAILANDRRIMETGEAAVFEEIADTPQGRRVFMSVKAPRRDAFGRVSGVVGISHDITERKRAEEALQATARLGEALTAIDALIHSSLDTGKAVQAALSEGVAALRASTAVVATHQPGAFRIDYQFGGPPQQIGRLIPDELDAPGLLALTGGETVAIEDARTDPRMSQVIAEEFDMRSLLVTPLLRERDTVGCLYFVYRERPHTFTPAEIDFVHRLGTSLSLALENAALYETQRNIALTLQAAFMHNLPGLEGLELGAVGLTASQPALVGGDFWDIYALPDGKILIVIGDVAGKGVQAAALTETVHSTMRAFAMVDGSPGFILRKTNELLLADDAVDSFVTALVLVLDPQTGLARIASAGHPGPVLISKAACETIDPEYRSPLGAFASEYPTTEAQVGRGGYLVLHTDGVTEARRDGELFGEERSRATLSALSGQPAQDVADGLASAASSFADALRDDLQVLVIRRM